jgi:hypothetical protein
MRLETPQKKHFLLPLRDRVSRVLELQSLRHLDASRGEL